MSGAKNLKADQNKAIRRSGQPGARAPVPTVKSALRTDELNQRRALERRRRVHTCVDWQD